MAERSDDRLEMGRAAETPISLSQALLAPLDAIFQAQIHAARSFLSLLLQIGFPHQELNQKGMAKDQKGTPFTEDFYIKFEREGEEELKRLSIPSLALVPLSPLAVEAATFKLEMRAENIDRHVQTQAERGAADADVKYSDTRRPWFLVPDPISIRGTLAPSAPRERSAAEGSTVQIEVKVGRIAMPSGLDRLLTSLTESLSLSSEPPSKNNKQPEPEGA
jgi:hypothetical protein